MGGRRGCPRRFRGSDPTAQPAYRHAPGAHHRLPHAGGAAAGLVAAVCRPSCWWRHERHVVERRRRGPAILGPARRPGGQQVREKVRHRTGEPARSQGWRSEVIRVWRGPREVARTTRGGGGSVRCTLCAGRPVDRVSLRQPMPWAFPVCVWRPFSHSSGCHRWGTAAHSVPHSGSRDATCAADADTRPRLHPPLASGLQVCFNALCCMSEPRQCTECRPCSQCTSNLAVEWWICALHGAAPAQLLSFSSPSFPQSFTIEGSVSSTTALFMRPCAPASRGSRHCQ